MRIEISVNIYLGIYVVTLFANIASIKYESKVKYEKYKKSLMKIRQCENTVMKTC